MTAPPPANTSRSAWLALALIAPALSVGVVMSMIVAPGPIGKAVFVACKLWVVALPVIWWKLIDKQPLSGSPVKRGGCWLGAALGLLIAGAIGGAYWLLGDTLIPPADKAVMRAAAVDNGLANKWLYLAMCAYWITLNSLVEEYAFRWFITSKFDEALRGTVASKKTRMWLAIFGSAAVFTIHHVIAMRAQGLGWPVTILANVGVFAGGSIWSWLYEKYESIWPAYISHAIVDIPIFVIGWHLIFGF